MLITDKLPDGYYIKRGYNILEINTIFETHNLSELFSYVGEFKILSVKAKNQEGEWVRITIHRVMDYAELLNTNAEDLTTKSEDLKATYTHGVRFKKTRVAKKVYENLNTSTAKKELYLNDEKYDGHFHHHVAGTAMTGRVHSEDSQILEIR